MIKLHGMKNINIVNDQPAKQHLVIIYADYLDDV
jgi:hypothetical protein